jgi:hypothetical protein
MSYGHANCRDCGRPTNYYPEVGEDESGILCDLCKWRNCDHEWAWEHARMLCRQCGWERPSTETMEYAQERIAALEAELERVRAEPTACYVHPETGHGSATGANEPSYEMTAYVVDWKRRAEKAEAERDQALFVADDWHRQFKRAAKARREEKARAKKATEYARIEVVVPAEETS